MNDCAPLSGENGFLGLEVQFDAASCNLVSFDSHGTAEQWCSALCYLSHTPREAVEQTDC